MKRYSLIGLLLLLLATSTDIFCLKNRSSQSFMFTRPAYYNIAASQAFWHNIIYCNPPEIATSWQFITFYQKSSDNPNSNKSHRISEYFLLPGRYQLSVKGDSLVTQVGQERDIRAEWLQLPSNFNGTFTLFPEQKQIAFLADVKQDFKSCFEPDGLLGNLWFGMSTAITSVDNDLHLRQDTIMTASNQTIYGSLTRPELLFGKFYSKSSSLGFAEIRFKLGTELIFRDDFQVNVHSYVMIPLAEKQNNAQIFEAIRGFNGHLGLGTVVNLQMPLSCRESSYLLSLYLDIENIFLFQNKQFRSVDIMDKPWSRYLLLNRIDGTPNIPAINVLTQKFKVHPFNFVDVSTGLRFKQGRFEAECGYSLWAHGTEKLKLHSKFKEEYGIAAKPGDLTPEGKPATASKSTISHQAETDMNAKGEFIFVPIQENDLDLHSGASQETMVHRFNMALGFSQRAECGNGFFGFGAYGEFPQNNAALVQWGFWVKLGAAF